MTSRRIDVGHRVDVAVVAADDDLADGAGRVVAAPVVGAVRALLHPERNARGVLPVLVPRARVHRDRLAGRDEVVASVPHVEDAAVQVGRNDRDGDLLVGDHRAVRRAGVVVVVVVVRVRIGDRFTVDLVRDAGAAGACADDAVADAVLLRVADGDRVAVVAVEALVEVDVVAPGESECEREGEREARGNVTHETPPSGRDTIGTG